MTAMIALLFLTAGPGSDRLSIADLPAYKLALEDRNADSVPATFSEIWKAPESFLGRRVRVAGRIRRRFQQPAVGAFPALAEVWISSTEGNPICLVFPSEASREKAPEGEVEFHGTFLKLIRYRGGEADRLAPLIVGSGHPIPVRSKSAGTSIASSGAEDFSIFLAAGSAVVVLVILASKLWNRPARRAITPDPMPRFLDGEDPDGSP